MDLVRHRNATVGGGSTVVRIGGSTAFDSDAGACRKGIQHRQSSTYLLLTTLVASPLDARLPFFLVVITGAVIVAIDTAGAVHHDSARAALPLGAAISGKALAANRDGARRTQGRGWPAVLRLRVGLGCRGRSWSGSGDSGSVHAR